MITLAPSMPLSISRLGFLREIAASAAVAALTQGTALCLLPPLKTRKNPVEVALDGVILVEPARNDRLIDWFEARRISIASIGKAPGGPDLSHVDLRSAETARLMLEHLHAAGAARIGLVTGKAQRSEHAAGGNRHRDRRGDAAAGPHRDHGASRRTADADQLTLTLLLPVSASPGPARRGSGWP